MRGPPTRWLIIVILVILAVGSILLLLGVTTVQDWLALQTALPPRTSPPPVCYCPLKIVRLPPVRSPLPLFVAYAISVPSLTAIGASLRARPGASRASRAAASVLAGSMLGIGGFLAVFLSPIGAYLQAMPTANPALTDVALGLFLLGPILILSAGGVLLFETVRRRSMPGFPGSAG